MSKIRVHIADSQFLVREGLRALIETSRNFELTGFSSNESSLMKAVEDLEPDVIILDHQQTDSFSPTTLERLLSANHNSRVLIISEDSDPNSIYSVLGHGVNSYLTKHCEGEEIINALRATAKGERFFCNKVLDILMQRSFASPEVDCAATPLTHRELEVVRLTARGKVAKEIAKDLELSPHTIYTHRKKIMKKLNVRSSAELVHQAMKMGIIDQDNY